MWLLLCAVTLSGAVAIGGLTAALAWRGMWVQSCEGDVSERRASHTT